MKNFFFLLFLACIGCNSCTRKGEVQASYEDVQKDLIEESKNQHKAETERIREYIREKGWPMQETNTGLHYWVYETHNGEQSSAGKVAVISYISTLPDGTLCYQTSDDAPVEFRIGQDVVESGLHEALLLMRTGDKAKFILPSHLAFGFTGDSGRIPQNATVIYDIHLIGLK